MRVLLSSILNGIKLNKLLGSIDKKVSSIVLNSNYVKEGSVFVAVKGTNQDGNKFIDKAIKKGASAIITQTFPNKLVSGITYLIIDKVKDKLGLLASNFYNNPSDAIEVVGITGTNGKTSVATLSYDLFRILGKKVGLISTINICIGDKVVKDISKNTTPDVFTINSRLNDMVKAGCSHCFMEVSSHGIDQNRISGIKFKMGVFTNISRDHLDYHKSFKIYINVKKYFFSNYLNKNSLCLVNKDDKNHSIMIQNTTAKKYFYSLYSQSDFRAKIIEQTIEGTELFINSSRFWTHLRGKFNIYNLLAVYGIWHLLLGDDENIFNYISMLRGVRGRFESMLSKDKVLVIVDYAHTPEALENTLDCIRGVLKKRSRLITLVGCGGNRDKGKRSKMGKIACLNSDIIIFTSDNPRFENAMDIIEDMKKDLSDEEKRNIFVLENRKDAIKLSRDLSKKDDIILIAGKGHETYQEIKGVNYKFDDLKLAKEIFY